MQLSPKKKTFFSIFFKSPAPEDPCKSNKVDGHKHC